MIDKSKINIFKDGYKIIFQYPKEEEKPQRIDEYFTIRGGISWPGIAAPGYYCIFGLKNEPTLTEKNPLILLAEGKDSRMEKFFERMTLHATKTYCEQLFADVREENKGYEDSLYRFIRERKIKGIRLWDSSEFTGNVEYGVALIKQWRQDKSLRIQKDTILRDEIERMTHEDAKEIDKRFYAIAALIRVLCSFEAYPWRKPTRARSVGFSNWNTRGRKKDEWDGSYQEWTVS